MFVYCITSTYFWPHHDQTILYPLLCWQLWRCTDVLSTPETESLALAQYSPDIAAECNNISTSQASLSSSVPQLQFHKWIIIFKFCSSSYIVTYLTKIKWKFSHFPFSQWSGNILYENWNFLHTHYWPKFSVKFSISVFCFNSISLHTAVTFWHLTTYKHKDSLWKMKNISGEFSNLLYRPNILSSLIMMMMLLSRLFGYLNRKFYREFSQILLSVVWKETFNNNNNDLV